jgi:hypothetical protein
MGKANLARPQGHDASCPYKWTEVTSEAIFPGDYYGSSAEAYGPLESQENR